MAQIIFTNNAQTTLAAPISSTATSLSLTAGGGALFPQPSAGNTAFIGTLTKAGSPSTQEIVLVTARSGDNLTVTRAYEAVAGVQAALTWQAGDEFSNNPTAGGLNSFANAGNVAASLTTEAIDRTNQLQNWCIATGSANAISCSWGAITALGRVVGMPLRFLATATNTGAVTLNDGLGAVSLTQGYAGSGGYSLPPGAIQQSSIYEVFYDGYGYQLVNPNWTRVNFTGTVAGISGSGAVSIYANQINNLVTLSITGVLNTSTSGALSLSGIPAEFQPSVSQDIAMIAEDGGQPCMAMATLTANSGTVSIAKLIIAGGVLQFNAAGWTVGGNKGIPPTTLSYLLQ